MSKHYDAKQTGDPAEREAELFARLPDILRKAMEALAYAERGQGQFVRPEQIAEIARRHRGRLRSVVANAGETDVITLKAECSSRATTCRTRSWRR